ncbi:prepilin-type N-terminal cleavage/methylation domain-containing protein, partial [Cronobacter malonaticus]
MNRQGGFTLIELMVVI